MTLRKAAVFRGRWNLIPAGVFGVSEMIKKIPPIDAPYGDNPADDQVRTVEAKRLWGAPAEGRSQGTEISSKPNNELAFAARDDLIPSDTGIAKTKKDAISSLALNNLRGFVILIVLAFHSALAYLGSQGKSPFPFDKSPYEWRAFPILDSHRWLGFDIFCASQDVSLMALMFFLSALFTWPSLTRKQSRKFLSDRLLRLGVPFVFALAVVMPLALYPVYRVTAIDPSVTAYARHFLALPFWPNGPMWFLWQLLALNVVAAGLHRFAPHWVDLLGRCSSSARVHPGRYFAGLVVVSALAYIPLALAFTPWYWSEHGPFALQISRPLFYAVYFFAGLGVGAFGLERGLLAPDGILARRWGVWLAASLGSFCLWMGLTGLAMSLAASAPFVLQGAVDLTFAVACASGCFFMMAGCLRFGTRPSRLFGSLANNAFGLYLMHYVFVVWLQYALLGLALFAIAKASIVFGGTLLLSWMTIVAIRFIPFGTHLVGEKQRVFANSLSSLGLSTVKHNSDSTRRAFGAPANAR